jgi:hypothetical protein
MGTLCASPKFSYAPRRTNPRLNCANLCKFLEPGGAGVKQLQHAHIYIHLGSYKISIKRLPLFNIASGGGFRS